MKTINSYSYYFDAIVNESTGKTYRPGKGYEELEPHIKIGHLHAVAIKAGDGIRSGNFTLDFAVAEIEKHWPNIIDVKEFKALVVKHSVRSALDKRKEMKQ